MAVYGFSFSNNNPDQVFSFDDQVDTSRNPVAVGFVQAGGSSPLLQCTVGSNGKGRVLLNGTVSGGLSEDISFDGYSFSY